MDPLSAPALSLGAVSLLIQLLEGIKTGYEYFEVAVDAENSFRSLKLSLDFEYSRLLNWAEVVGFDKNTGHIEKTLKFNRPLIFALLSEYHLVLEKMREIGLHYDDMDLQGTDSPKDKGNDSANGSAVVKARNLIQSPDVPVEAKKHTAGLNHIFNLASGIKKVAKKPRSIRWAVREKTKFENYLERLGQLYGYLHECLDDHRMEVLQQNTEETKLAILQLTQSVTDIKLLIESRQIVDTIGSGDDTASILSQATTLVDANDSAGLPRSLRHQQTEESIFQRLAQFRRVYLESIASGTAASKSIELPGTLDEQTSIVSGTRSMGSYNGKTVWVEWKEYNEVPDLRSGSHDYVIPPEILSDVRWLVTLLQAPERPAEFCVPTCLGYKTGEDREGNSRIGFVYEVDDASRKPISLLQLLNKPVPGLADRVQLAQRLTNCLLYFHAVGWVHKALRSASILFFLEEKQEDGPQPGEVAKAFISGFEYARPDAQGRTTLAAPQDSEWALYCHPHYLQVEDPNAVSRKHYGKTFDIYSLGIILVEIAYWKSAREIFKEANIPIGAKKDIQNIRSRLLSEGSPVLNHVRVTMGDRYYDATRACINGLDRFGLLEGDEAEPLKAAFIQHGYLRLVVDVLRGIDV